MFLWRSLRALCVNFVGVHQLQEFADSFTGFSRLKVILCQPPRSEGILEHEKWCDIVFADAMINVSCVTLLSASNDTSKGDPPPPGAVGGWMGGGGGYQASLPPC